MSDDLRHYETDRRVTTIDDETVETDDDGVPLEIPMARVGVLKGVWNLANYIVGAGVLGLPYACAKAGLLPAMALLIVVGFAARFSFALLIASSNLADAYNYEDLGMKAYGKCFAMFIKICIIIDSLGPLAGYMIVMGDAVFLVMNGFISEKRSLWLNRPFLSFMQVMIIVVPLCFVRNISSLGFTSLLSLMPMAYLMLMQIGTLSEAGLAPELHMFAPDLFLALPIVVFAYSCHQLLPSISKELHDANGPTADHDVGRVVKGGLGLSGLAYVWVGLLGYLQFGSEAEGNVMKNFPTTPSSQVLWISTSISIALSYPVVMYPARISLDRLLFKSRPLTYARFVVENLCIVWFAYGLAVLLPSFATLIGVFGAVTSTAIGYIIPPLFFLALDPTPLRSSTMKKGAIALMAIGSCCGFASFISVLVDYIQNF